jgi:hypothetical protein
MPPRGHPVDLATVSVSCGHGGSAGVWLEIGAVCVPGRVRCVPSGQQAPRSAQRRAHQGHVDECRVRRTNGQGDRTDFPPWHAPLMRAIAAMAHPRSTAGPTRRWSCLDSRRKSPKPPPYRYTGFWLRLYRVLVSAIPGFRSDRHAQAARSKRHDSCVRTLVRSKANSQKPIANSHELI